MEPENGAREKAMRSRGVGYISVRKAYSAATNHPVNVQVLSGKRTAAVRKMYSQIRQADKNKGLQICSASLSSFICKSSIKQKNHEGDSNDRREGCDEDYFGGELVVAAVLEAQHSGGYGRGHA